LRAEFYFAGVIIIIAGVIFFFIEAVMLTFADPRVLIEQMRLIAIYGLIFKMVGVILIILGISTLVYGIFAKPTQKS